jgi:hypothetical protein
MVEKRRSWRIEHDGEVNLQILGQQWPAKFINLSEGGCLVSLAQQEIAKQLAVAVSAVLEFPFPNDLEDTYSAQATVSHFRTDGDLVYIGFAFSNPEDECVARIKEFIEMFTAFA